MAEKSILEQALLQVTTLEEAVKKNAKGILASTMKQDLKEILKEEISEEDEMSEQEDDSELNDDDAENVGDDEVTSDMDSPEDVSNDDNDSEMVDDETTSDDDLETDLDTNTDDEETSDDDILDLTHADDEEVLKVYKKLKPEDGIIVKKDGNSLKFQDGESDYIIQLDDEDNDDDFSDDTFDDEENEESEIFENEEIDDDSILEIDLEEEDDVNVTKDVEEAARTKSNPHGGENAGIKSKKVFKAGSNVSALNEEIKNLKEKNNEYKKALVLFKEKLNEVAVFNASLAYSTRLFTEHSTTKQEKIDILKRFDGVKTLNESKNLYQIIEKELDNKTPINEAVTNKLINNPSTSSKEMLMESKAYENEQFKRIKELMGFKNK